MYYLAVMVSILCGLALTAALVSAKATYDEQNAKGGSNIARELVRVANQRDKALTALHESRALVQEQALRLHELQVAVDTARGATERALAVCPR